MSHAIFYLKCQNIVFIVTECFLFWMKSFKINLSAYSGESAFHTMMDGFGWAKNPMIRRVDDLKESVPITLLYGSRSWVDKSPGEKIRENRSKDAYVDIQVS